MTTRPCCIDLYSGDDVSDSPTSLAGLDRAKASGIFACIHKASEGNGYRDARYDARRTKWMSGGLIVLNDLDETLIQSPPLWGAYHFFHGSDPAREAANFLMAARLTPGDMAFLDWEAVGASGYQPSIEAADAFCSAVEAALGRPCGVYGGNVPRERFEAEKAPDATLERFAARPLWFCAYGTYSPDRLQQLIPIPWREKGIWLWQDDGDKDGPGPHVVPGIQGYCDNSTVVGGMTFSRLRDEWVSAPEKAAEPPILPPPTEPPPAPEPESAPPPLLPPEPPKEPEKPSLLAHLQDEAKRLESELKHIEEELSQELQRNG